MNAYSSEQRSKWYWGLLIGIVVLGALIRLVNLDEMAFHHDESLHAQYSHYIFWGNLDAYKYDPTYHGPFLYHWGALFFALFGDNDYVARLPYVAVGLLTFYLVWRLRPWIGDYGALFSLALLATSPTMSYFSRFARNDVYMAAWALGMVVFALEYMRSRRMGHLLWMAFFLALMYCTKENSYMTGFILGSFLVFYAIYYVVSMAPEARKVALRKVFVENNPLVKLTGLYAIFSVFAFSLVYYVSYHEEFKELARQNRASMGAQDLTKPVLDAAWNQYMAAHGWIVPAWGIGAGVIVVALFLALAILQRRYQADPPSEERGFSGLARNNLPVALALLIIVSIYSFLFTTMGTNPIGMRDGVIDYLLYWMGQQGEPRIPGPADFFVGRLLIYEFAAVLTALIAYVVYSWKALGPVHFFAFQFAVAGLVFPYWQLIQDNPPPAWLAITIGAVFFAVGLAIFLGRSVFSLFSFVPEQEEQLDAKPLDREALSGDGVRWLFIYWSLLAFLIYAVLEEKVPWLQVHQAQPLILLAGVFLGDVFMRLRPGFWKGAFVALASLLLTYQASASIQFNWHRPDDPREMLVYTQNSHDVLRAVREIKETAYHLGEDYHPIYHPISAAEKQQRPPLAAVHSDISWPFNWYFRHYRIDLFAQNNLPPNRNVPFVLVEPRYENRMKIWGQGNYSKRRIRYHVWWQPPGNDGLPFTHYRNTGRPWEAWAALGRYLLWREPWTPVGGRSVLLYSRDPMFERDEPVEAAQGYEEAPRPLPVVEMAGEPGTGEGQFNEPRGVALSPDEERLYVLDAMNGRIQVFDRDLNYISQMGSPGQREGQFTLNLGNGPNGGIDVGPNGTIYATDTWNQATGGRILRFRPNGQPMSPLVPQGDAFYFPRGLAVAPDGTLYVADTGNHRIVRFAPDGRYQGVFAQTQGFFNEPVGVAVGDDGNLYVCDVVGKRVISFTRQGNFVREWKVLGWSPDTPDQLNWIEPYVALDPDNNVYITDSTSDTVHIFSRSQNVVMQLGGTGKQRGALLDPKGIVVDSNYNMYIADSRNHRIVKARPTP